MLGPNPRGPNPLGLAHRRGTHAAGRAPLALTSPGSPWPWSGLLGRYLTAGPWLVVAVLEVRAEFLVLAGAAPGTWGGGAGGR